MLSKTPLALDGDLLLHGSRANEPSKTELAVRKLGEKLDLSDAAIRRDLERGDQRSSRTRNSTSAFSISPTRQSQARAACSRAEDPPRKPEDHTQAHHGMVRETRRRALREVPRPAIVRRGDLAGAALRSLRD